MNELKRARSPGTGLGSELPVSRLAYEVREQGAPGLQELGVLAAGLVYRWRVPAALWTGGDGVHHLICELEPWSRLLRPAARPWDAGRCVADEDLIRSVPRFVAGLQRGRLLLRLLGGRASGTYRLERLRSHPGRWVGGRVGEALPRSN